MGEIMNRYIRKNYVMSTQHPILGNLDSENQSPFMKNFTVKKKLGDDYFR